jgi:hypothetical protein
MKKRHVSVKVFLNSEARGFLYNPKDIPKFKNSIVDSLDKYKNRDFIIEVSECKELCGDILSLEIDCNFNFNTEFEVSESDVDFLSALAIEVENSKLEAQIESDIYNAFEQVFNKNYNESNNVFFDEYVKRCRIQN